jgi:cation diffusion facilitator family transporter
MDPKERAVFWGMCGSAFGLLPTAYVTFISNSLVLFGDFLRCVVEFLAIVVSYFILRRALRGERQFYDYGFGKLEQLGSVCVALAMLFTFFVLAALAINRLLTPVEVQNVGSGFALSLIAVLANGALWLHNRALAQADGSPILQAQAQLFRAKALASLVVVVTLGSSLISSSSTIPQILDPIGSLLLGAFLFYSAVLLLSSSMDDLLDRSVKEAIRLLILRVLIAHEEAYHGFRGIKTRRVGTKIFVEIMLEFAGSKPFGEVAEASRRIEAGVSGALGGSEVTVLPVLKG